MIDEQMNHSRVRIAAEGCRSILNGCVFAAARVYCSNKIGSTAVGHLVELLCFLMQAICFSAAMICFTRAVSEKNWSSRNANIVLVIVTITVSLPSSYYLKYFFMKM